MSVQVNQTAKYSTVFLRFALGIAFLSAVADRFGLWGAPGATNVAWGNFDSFLTYTAKLNFFLPNSLISVVGWLATGAEIVLGILLIVGFRIRETAFISGVMLILFAAAMTLALGVKVPLDYSVFAASAGAFLLAAQDESPWSIDKLLNQKNASPK